MPHPTNIIQNQKGFISIIAIGIVALLAIFGIIVQLTVIDSYSSVSKTNNYYQAQDISDSVVEFLQLQISQTEAGYNTSNNSTASPSTIINCSYENGRIVTAGGANISPLCSNLTNFIGPKKTTVTFEIKGRSGTNETLISSITNLCPRGSCYTVPFPGTGDAGKRCNLYQPNLGNITPQDTYVPGALTGNYNIDPVNYSCNWGKLSFGNSSTDRVAIPLYYEDANGNVINPFNISTPIGDRASQFKLRLRTPCKPCGDGNGGTRTCTVAGQDETVCSSASDRYHLDDGGSINNRSNPNENDIVVQWQLSGMCPKPTGGGLEECGMIGISDRETNTGAFDRSALTEYQINEKPESILLNIIAPSSQGNDTSVFPNQVRTISSMLSTMQKPVLTLFLSESLIADQGRSVPYLEYQVITDKPVSDAKTKLNVTVNVEGSTFTKTLFKDQEKALIDFAIQN